MGYTTRALRFGGWLSARKAVDAGEKEKYLKCEQHKTESLRSTADVNNFELGSALQLLKEKTE